MVEKMSKTLDREEKNDEDTLKLQQFFSDYAKTALSEAYRWEDSTLNGATFQIAILSFLITGIITLEIGLYENGFKYFYLSLFLSTIIVLTMLIAILLSLISQWRMKRYSFPDSGKVIDMIKIEKEASINRKLLIGYNQLAGDYRYIEKTVNQNNKKRTCILNWANIFAIMSLGEMIVAILIMYVIIISRI